MRAIVAPEPRLRLIVPGRGVFGRRVRALIDARTPTLLRVRIMRILTSSLLCSILMICAAACDKGEAKEAGSAAEAEAEKGKAGAVADEAGAAEDEGADAKDGPLRLPSLGVEGDAPAGAQMSEMMGSVVVQAPDLTVTVESGDDKPKTGEEAQAAAADHTPVAPKIETLPDGYVLSFTNEGGMGTNYWIESLREIDGKAVWCTTTTSSQAQMDAALAFCKSLRKSS